MRVKICGITSVADALLTEQAGADAIGINFIRASKRFVTAEQARAISQSVGPLLTTVGIFMNQPLSEVKAIARSLHLHAVQLHGDETAAYAAELGREFTVIKAFSFTPQLTPELLAHFPADAILLDGIKPGSGQSFQWTDAVALKGLPKLILAGGLTPANVAEAISILEPYAVDLASGVEASPGVKDPAKVHAFIRNARTGHTPQSSSA